ncbi:MAG: hypothetical protein AAF998_02865 [Bacteroidota bacterium]
MKKQTYIWISRATGSLTGYFLAQRLKVKTWYPYVILGGLAGAVLADAIIEATRDKDEIVLEMNQANTTNTPT